jgi:hypothetical protein
MSVIASDIKFLLSGGTHNVDPNESIGGEASFQPIIGTMNNLFRNITAEESSEGRTDYRCFYLKNSNATDVFYDAFLYIANQVPSGSSVQIGSYSSTELQRISLRGSKITGGSMKLSFDGEETAAINWDGSPNNFKTNTQNALNALVSLGGVSIPSISFVEHVGPPPTAIYYLDVYFLGADDKRGQPLMEVSDLSLTGCDIAEVIRITAGGPVNNIASKLDFDTDAPNGVTFSDYDVDTPFVIGNLRGGDQVPIWIKRYTPAGSSSMASDGVTLEIIGTIIQ